MDLRLLCCLLISSIITNIKGSPSTSSDKPDNVPPSYPPPAIVRFTITTGQVTQECVCSGAAFHAAVFGSIVTSKVCVDKLTPAFGKKDTAVFAVWPDGTHHPVLRLTKFSPDTDGKAARIGMVIVKIKGEETRKKFALISEMPPKAWQLMMATWQYSPDNHWIPVAFQPPEGILPNDAIPSLHRTTYSLSHNADMAACDTGSPLYAYSLGKINPTLFGIRINAQEYMNVFKFADNIHKKEESLVESLERELQ